MTIQRDPKNVARDLMRQAWPKRQPRRPKPNPDGFPSRVKDIIQVRSGGMCELDACGVAEVIHHRAPRAMGGTHQGWVNWAANGLHLTDRCHLKVEGRLPDSSRTRSYVNGWLVSRLGHQVAADVPVLYRGRWVLLADDGSVRPIEGVA